MHRLLPVLAALTVALAAQDKAPGKLNVKLFLPDDHRNLAVVDFAAMRERGIWDELEASVLKVAFVAIEKENGFRLGDLDRLTMVISGGGDPNEGRASRIVVLEGNKPLGVAASVEQLWDTATIGGQRVRRRATQWSDDMLVKPRPEVQIIGAASFLEPVLTGTPHAGQPCPDIMSLLSARADRLAWFAFDVTNVLAKRDVLDTLLPDVAWPVDDAPAFVCLQLLATGDPDDPHLTIEATVRHTKDGAGIAASEAAVKAQLERAANEPKLRIVRPVLLAAQVRHDRGDLIVSSDLGRARVAVGQVAMLMVPMMMFGIEAVPAQAAVRAVPAPPPPPEPKK